MDKRSTLEAKSRVQELKELAERLDFRNIKKPLVIEVAGTPKSGKTTSVDALAKFFRRLNVDSSSRENLRQEGKRNIRVHILAERASICPISDKRHLYFNAWTGMMSITGLIEMVEGRKADVIILDRGMFDTLVWMHLLKDWGAVTAEELRIIERFFLLDRWSDLIDIVAVISVEPETALSREFKDQITDKFGSIMQPKVLKEYNSKLNRCIKKYKSATKRFVRMDTTNMSPREGVAKIAYEILSAADELINEKIAVVDRALVLPELPPTGVIIEKEAIKKMYATLWGKFRWEGRKEAESDVSVIQIVPVCVIRCKDEVLVLTIREEDAKSRFHNQLAIWVGGHIRRFDVERRKKRKRKGSFKRCLKRELSEELKIELSLERIPQLPKAIIWDNSVPRSAQHLGVFYEIELQTPRDVLHQREIWETSHKSFFCEFHKITDNLGKLTYWEPWSLLYMKYVLNLDVPIRKGQRFLI